jgi:hypothetical protein
VSYTVRSCDADARADSHKPVDAGGVGLDDRDMDRTQALERGRDAFARQAWSDAYDGLAAAAEPEDLERLATAAYMLGRDEEFAAAL